MPNPLDIISLLNLPSDLAKVGRFLLKVARFFNNQMIENNNQMAKILGNMVEKEEDGTPKEIGDASSEAAKR